MELQLKKIEVDKTLAMVNVCIDDVYIDDVAIDDNNNLDFEGLRTKSELKKIAGVLDKFVKSGKDIQVFEI